MRSRRGHLICWSIELALLHHHGQDDVVSHFADGGYLLALIEGNLFFLREVLEVDSGKAGGVDAVATVDAERDIAVFNLDNLTTYADRLALILIVEARGVGLTGVIEFLGRDRLDGLGRGRWRHSRWGRSRCVGRLDVGLYRAGGEQQ